MGKAKKKRLRPPKPEPTGLPSVKDTEKLEDETELMALTGHGTVSSLVEELQSVNVETRECGCATLANLVNEPEAIPQLLQHNIVKIVAPLIVDPCAHIRHVALGALRNLSVAGGYDVCEEMVQKDILTPLVALFQKEYVPGWKPEKSEKTVKHNDTTQDIFTEAVHLLWNLCESTDMAVTVINKENLIQYLLPCLQWDQYGYSMSIAVAQCLHTVTDNNKMAAMICQGSEVMALLHKLMVPLDTAESILFSTLIIGIVLNVSDLRSPQMPISSTVEMLAKVLSVDVSGLVQEAAQNRQVNGSEEADGDSCGAIADVKNTEPKGKLKDVEQILMAHQTSLEILTNLCCSGDEEWEDVESNESSSSDDMNMDVNMDEDVSQDFTPLSMPTEVHDALVRNDILTKVLNKAQPVEEGKETILNNCVGGKKIVSSLQRVQVHALLCLNNMMNTLNPDQLGGLPHLHKMWEGLVPLSTSPQAKARLELLEAVTSAMRAVMQKLAELESPKFSEITIADLQFLFSMSRQCDNAQVRVNAVRCVATIGGLLAKIQTPHPLLKEIGHFLVEVIGHDSDLWVVAEALDSLFDVFGEDHIDPVVKEIGLVERLKNILPMLKSKINSQRGHLGEHYPIITTAKTNLVRFIKYKTSC